MQQNLDLVLKIDNKNIRAVTLDLSS